MSEAGVPVYINPGIGLRIPGANGITGSKCSLDAAFDSAASGNKHVHFTETAVELQLTVFRKRFAARQIQCHLPKMDLCLSMGQHRQGDQMIVFLEGGDTGETGFPRFKMILYRGGNPVACWDGLFSV